MQSPGHAAQAFELLARDVSAREVRRPQRPEKLENMVIEAIVDENGLAIDRTGDGTRSEQRRFADFLQRQDGQVKGDVRQLFIVQDALRRAQQVPRVAEASLHRIIDLVHGTLCVLPAIAHEPTCSVGNAEAHHGPRSAIHRL